ncbi:MAG TPA: efflux transporter outer membrane subunit [Terriglobia bacterium]|nr:efflux transporter outer membrane subunit [Terriglobia bacterium]
MDTRKPNAVVQRGPGPSACGLLAAAGCQLLLTGACVVGPNYHRPTAPVPAAYKETPPPPVAAAGAEWSPAQPSEGAARGKWWEVYNDPQLNALEEQVSISNQNVLLAEAQFREAEDAARVARSSLFPTVTSSPSISTSRTSGTLFNVNAGNLTSGERNSYDLPFTVSYLADIWGSIRRSARASAETAQASFAELENARLSYHAALAQDYFELHGSDGEQDLLQRTVQSYTDSLQLTKDRFASGVASGADVAQAQAQLDTTRAQLIDLGVARAQLEHAIAILTGKPPAALSIPAAPNKLEPPPVPVGLPSTLLERRPDIASAERQMAAANEQIGIAQAAYYPSLTLSATGGLESGSISQWLTWPSRFWSLGPTLAETLFDAGRRRAQVAGAQAAFDASVATYRQTVLTGFQQVEDNLAALRILAGEATAEDAAIHAAQQSLDISTYQYKAGTVDYLTVLTEQTILLQDQVQAVNILTRRMTASVLLIEALGGGWDASALPAPQALVHGN